VRYGRKLLGVCVAVRRLGIRHASPVGRRLGVVVVPLVAELVRALVLGDVLEDV
jgi:hypothetical protein